MRERPRSDQPTSVRIHQGGIALLGKWHSGVEAGHEHRNFQRQPRAAPNGVLCFFRSAHRVSRQKDLRPESVDLKTNAFDCGND
jgi:hypothetical protein